MSGRKRCLAALAFSATLFAVPLASAAHAHERRMVGSVQMVVGWLNEPAYSGFLNGVQVRFSDESGAPITDVGDAMKVEVTFGDQKVGPLGLRAAFGVPGEYRSPMVPNRPGVYTFRFLGTVKDQQLDERFTSSEKTFNSIQDTVDVQFPAKDPNAAQLGSRIERLEPRIDGVRAEASSGADDANSAATRATFVGALGVLVGAVALVTGRTGRKKSSVAASEPTAPSAKSRSEV